MLSYTVCCILRPVYTASFKLLQVSFFWWCESMRFLVDENRKGYESTDIQGVPKERRQKRERTLLVVSQQTDNRFLLYYTHLMSTKCAFRKRKFDGCGCPNYEVMSSPVFVSILLGHPVILSSEASVFLVTLIRLLGIRHPLSNLNLDTTSIQWGSLKYNLVSVNNAWFNIIILSESTKHHTQFSHSWTQFCAVSL